MANAPSAPVSKPDTEAALRAEVEALRAKLADAGVHERDPEAPKAKKAWEEDITVVALRDGTYPEPRDTYAVYRKAGTVFKLAHREHLSHWMREVKPGEKIELPAAPEVPQTSARGQRRAQQFPALS